MPYWRLVLASQKRPNSLIGQMMDAPVRLATTSFSGRERDRLFTRLVPGRPFVDVAAISGVDLSGDGRSAVAADLDGDGDLDLVVREQQAPKLHLFRNDGPSGGSVEVRPKGKRGPAMATVIAVAGGRVQARPVLYGHGYLAQGPATVHVGLGAAEAAERIEVRFASGAVAVARDVPDGSVVEVVDGEAPRIVPRPPARPLAPAKKAAGGAAAPPLDALVAAVDPAGRDGLGAALAPGKTRVVNLWAPWCKPCRTELPELAKLAASRSELAVVTIAVDGTEEEVAQAAKKLAPGLVSARLPPGAAATLGVGAAVPTTLVYGPDGTLRRGFLGPVNVRALAP